MGTIAPARIVSMDGSQLPGTFGTDPGPSHTGTMGQWHYLARPAHHQDRPRRGPRAHDPARLVLGPVPAGERADTLVQGALRRGRAIAKGRNRGGGQAPGRRVLEVSRQGPGSRRSHTRATTAAGRLLTGFRLVSVDGSVAAQRVRIALVTLRAAVTAQAASCEACWVVGRSPCEHH